MITKTKAMKMTTNDLSKIENDLYIKLKIMEEKNNTDTEWYKELKHDFNIVSEIISERENDFLDDEDKEEFEYLMNALNSKKRQNDTKIIKFTWALNPSTAVIL